MPGQVRLQACIFDDRDSNFVDEHTTPEVVPMHHTNRICRNANITDFLAALSQETPLQFPAY